jgi:hypothetical protein
VSDGRTKDTEVHPKIAGSGPAAWKISREFRNGRLRKKGMKEGFTGFLSSELSPHSN